MACVATAKNPMQKFTLTFNFIKKKISYEKILFKKILNHDFAQRFYLNSPMRIFWISIYALSYKRYVFAFARMRIFYFYLFFYIQVKYKFVRYLKNLHSSPLSDVACVATAKDPMQKFTLTFNFMNKNFPKKNILFKKF